MSIIFFVSVFASFWATCASNPIFLGSRSRHLGGADHIDGISDLLKELEVVAGRDQRIATQQRVDRLERALKPMFDSMPKDGSGKVGFDSTRYLLHRLFVQRHGWFVNGLDAAGDQWNSSSPTDIFKEHATDHIHGFFEDKLEEGFDLHHIAVLASTFEHLVHTDSIERLRVAHSMLGYSDSNGNLAEEEVEKVIRAYMIMYVQGLNHSSLAYDEWAEASANILEVYPTWPDTEVFVREVRAAVLADVVPAERTSWSSTLRVLEEIGERYGRWQNKECHALKTTLMGLETPGTGRVTLDKFYAGRLNDENWMFLESVPYLEQLGALDRSDASHLSVIIPNYINSPSNCVASSKFYSVCCVDECDALLSTLESRVAGPEASPGMLLQLIGGLASDTVAAPRSLPDSLAERLNEIAKHHGGSVPLHGRLFAQWMHHAYPRECPYPHLSGTTTPVTADKYQSHTGNSGLVSDAVIMEVLEQSKNSKREGDIELPWSEHEELFFYRSPVKKQAAGTAKSISQVMVALIACASFISVATRAFTFSSEAKGCSRKDCFV